MCVEQTIVEKLCEKQIIDESACKEMVVVEVVVLRADSGEVVCGVH